MRQVYRSLAVAIALASATLAVAQAPNPAQRNQGDVFNFGGTPMRTQDTIISGSAGSVFSDPNVAHGIARSGKQGGVHITPVPEPSQWAMMLAGLALVGFIVRRSAKRDRP